MDRESLIRANDFTAARCRGAMRQVWEALPAEFRRDVNPAKASELLGAGTAACSSGQIAFAEQALLLRDLALLADHLDRGAAEGPGFRS